MWLVPSRKVNMYSCVPQWYLSLWYQGGKSIEKSLIYTTVFRRAELMNWNGCQIQRLQILRRKVSKLDRKSYWILFNEMLKVQSTTILSRKKMGDIKSDKYWYMWSFPGCWKEKGNRKWQDGHLTKERYSSVSQNHMVITEWLNFRINSGLPEVSQIAENTF